MANIFQVGDRVKIYENGAWIEGKVTGYAFDEERRSNLWVVMHQSGYGNSGQMSMIVQPIDTGVMSQPMVFATQMPPDDDDDDLYAMDFGRCDGAAASSTMINPIVPRGRGRGRPPVAIGPPDLGRPFNCTDDNLFDMDFGRYNAARGCSTMINPIVRRGRGRPRGPSYGGFPRGNMLNSTCITPPDLGRQFCTACNVGYSSRNPHRCNNDC